MYIYIYTRMCGESLFVSLFIEIRTVQHQYGHRILHRVLSRFKQEVKKAPTRFPVFFQIRLRVFKLRFSTESRRYSFARSFTRFPNIHCINHLTDRH